jgi:adenosylcobinamide kinase / adenosylcobinamide-phosphate guanylyltransferase
VKHASRSELILGGVRSGKSLRALSVAKACGGSVAFVATAQARDGNMRARIARHQADRPRGWATVEEPFDLVAACRRLVGQHDLLIVDCLTLWVSNLMLRGDRDDVILAEAENLAKLMTERALSFIVVSNEVGSGVHPLTEVGLRFGELLGVVNQRVAAAADGVTLMVAGLPMTIKDTPSSRGPRERIPEAP